MSYQHKQVSAEAVSSGNKIAIAEDIRLPFEQPRWICQDYKYYREQYVAPQNNQTVLHFW